MMHRLALVAGVAATLLLGTGCGGRDDADVEGSSAAEPSEATLPDGDVAHDDAGLGTEGASEGPGESENAGEGATVERASDAIEVRVVPGLPYQLENQWLDADQLTAELRVLAKVNRYRLVELSVPARASLTQTQPAIDAIHEAGLVNVSVRTYGDR